MAEENEEEERDEKIRKSKWKQDRGKYWSNVFFLLRLFLPFLYFFDFENEKRGSQIRRLNQYLIAFKLVAKYILGFQVKQCQ